MTAYTRSPQDPNNLSLSSRLTIIHIISNSNHQDATLYNNPYFTLNALYVSGGFSAHRQELEKLCALHRVLSSFSAAFH
jgi:hypothetical protein